ncbi:MAG: radical SAM protein, partial [Firmicutes bacterium]|nr:radical SAM protein [Bacillota bacterium]
MERIEGKEGIWMTRTCPEHGRFSVLVWKDYLDFEEWTEGEAKLSASEEDHCSGNCRKCSYHLQDCCCVILEVTKNCDLHCAYCFAYGGDANDMPALDELKKAVDCVADKGKSPLLQLSGGEPSLRDDLPELVSYAKEKGCSYVQINTNGI